MATELPLSNFGIIKLVFLEKDFDAVNFSGVKKSEEKPQS